MKKILAISMVLVLMMGAAFAEVSSSSNAVVTTTVAAGQGVGSTDLGDATIGDGSSFGFIVYYGDATSTKITSNDYKINGKSAGTKDSYTFLLSYIGKEEKSTQHKVTAACANGWVLDGGSSSTASQQNNISIEATAGAGNNSVSATASGADIITTFGGTSQAPVASAVNVGTYTLSWADDTELEVGTYKATVTFTVADV